MLNISLSSSTLGFNLQNPKFSHPSHVFSQDSFLNSISPSLSKSKSPIKTLSLKCQYSEQRQTYAPRQVTNLSPKVFVQRHIYKGKAVMVVEPCNPEFAPLGSGAYKVSKEGFILLQFAPAASVRQYDWGRKQVFALSITEMGELMSLGEKESCEFFHDPSIGRSDEGMVRKIFKVEPLPDGSGRSFHLTVKNNRQNVDEDIFVPVTKAEFTVLMSSFNYLIPYLMGLHTFTNSIRPDTNNFRPGVGADSEWSR